MKNAMVLTLSLTVAASVFAQGYKGKHRQSKKPLPTLYKASQLSQSLIDLSNVSKRISKRAKINDNFRRSHKFKRLSRLSENLAKKVDVKVIKKIKQGSKKHALKKLRGLKSRFNLLVKINQKIDKKTERFNQKVHKVLRLSKVVEKMLSFNLLKENKKFGHQRPFGSGRR